jgi:predicted membrane chloride channel (bestrophin family)
MKTIKGFIKILDHQTVIVTLLAVAATYFCNRYGFYADLPSGLIGIAIIFPIVFSINAAYRRREEALKSFATIKAHLVAIYYGYRDWQLVNTETGKDMKQVIENLFDKMKIFLSSKKKEEEKDKLQSVYKVFSEISQTNEELRNRKLSGGEMSRMNQYLRSVIIEFEKMRNIHNYRTPISLRAYSQVFLNIFPILYAPYFAEMCNTTFTSVGYGVAVIYSLVLVSLDNIQEDLESPYDEVGADDVNLDVVDEFKMIIQE